MADRGVSEPILQNLKDAGCPPETIGAFAESKGAKQQLAVLADYRRRLLEGIHVEEEKLSCLDYLIFQLRKENN